jgi:uncharacterized protein (DUF433 family)
MAMTERIEIDPSVMLGKPVIRNTRISVELILRKLAEGAAVTDLLDAYTRLSEADIRACLAYAADAVARWSERQQRSVDKDLMEAAYQEGRILLTEDKDFG